MKFISNMVFIAGTFALFACTAGTSTNQSISAAVASGSSCNPIANGGQCTINLTYNANGVSGLALGTNPATLNSQFSFKNTLSLCPVPLGNQNQTCTVVLYYTSTGTTVTQNINFTLGNATSNQIVASGQ